MTVYTGLKSIGTSAAVLCDFPAGVCSVTISVTGANTAYIGTSSGVTTSGGSAGFPIVGGSAPVTIQGFAGGGGATLYAIASGATTPVGYFVSTATGGTGL